jgi:hypothetical protein
MLYVYSARPVSNQKPTLNSQQETHKFQVKRQTTNGNISIRALRGHGDREGCVVMPSSLLETCAFLAGC